MNPWLERALWSVAASAVSTAMWVTTAKNPAATKRRRRRGKSKKQGAQASPEPDRSPVPRSPGAQAVRDHENGHREGLSAGEFVDNLQRAGARMARFGVWLKESGETKPSRADPKPKQNQTAPAQQKSEDVSSPLAEAKKAARKRLQQEVAARSGMNQAAEKWQETSATIKDAGDKLSDSLKRKLPENWSQGVGEVGRSMKDAFHQAGQNVRQGLESNDALGEKFDRGIRDLGRWMQGPGAPKRVESVDADPSSANGDWVEARMPDEASQGRKPSSTGRATGTKQEEAREREDGTQNPDVEPTSE